MVKKIKGSLIFNKCHYCCRLYLLFNPANLGRGPCLLHVEFILYKKWTHAIATYDLYTCFAFSFILEMTYNVLQLIPEHSEGSSFF